jgi:hypothetical protein
VVESQITALYFARLASLNAAPSSELSTVNPLATPSCWMAAMPVGMESCRKPAVLEKTRTEKGSAAAFGAFGTTWLTGAAAFASRGGTWAAAWAGVPNRVVEAMAREIRVAVMGTRARRERDTPPPMS